MYFGSKHGRLHERLDSIDYLWYRIDFDCIRVILVWFDLVSLRYVEKCAESDPCDLNMDL